MSNMLQQSHEQRPSLSYQDVIEIIRNNIQWLKEYNTNQTKNMLSINLEDFSCTTDQTNYIVQKTIRKQFVGLLVLTYCDIPNKCEINSFYDLWNIIFPNDKQTKMRLSKYDMLKENEKGTKNKNNSSKRMSKQKRCEAQQYDEVNFPFQSQPLFPLNYTSPISTFTSTTNLYQVNNNNSTINNANINSLGYVASAEDEEEEQHSLNSYSQEIFEKNQVSAHLNTNLIQIPQKNISLINSNFQSQNAASIISFPEPSNINQQIAYQPNNSNDQNQIGQIVNKQHQIKQINNQLINSQNCNSSQQLQSIEPSYYAQQQSISNLNLQSSQLQQQSHCYQESQSQVTAQNLKSLEYYYQVQQNEQQAKEINQHFYAYENNSSVSVNLNSEPEFFTSSSRLDEDFEQNQYIPNHVQEQYQSHQQQAFDSVEHQKYQTNYNKKEEAYIPPVPEVQQYSEYPQYMNYQYQSYPSEQIDNYNLFNYDNQIINYSDNKEELVDSFFNRQLL
ncbi:hypothetical protein ABPG74_021156 [Tetrahymena malaccensis]